MIISGDIATILAKDFKSFGIEIYRKGAIPIGKVTSERICILPKENKETAFWDKCFVEVNFCVPDHNGMANTLRLNNLERQTRKLGGTGLLNDTRYSYGVYSTSQEKDTELGCHYVNIKLLFKAKNY